MSNESSPVSPLTQSGGTMDSPALERARQNLDEYMSKKGLRTTTQRTLILTTFFQAKTHPTIAELLEEVRKEDPRVGYATVYRTMRMLSEGGIVQELHFDEGVTRYEILDEQSHHDHLICEECGLIVEFEESLIEQLQERVAAQHGFQLTHHKHELYGRCRDLEACVERRQENPAGGSS